MTARPGVHLHSLDLVAHLAGREFRLRYRRSLLGWLWAVVLPLARLVVLAFIFTEVIPLDIEHYTTFLYTGLLAWIWFSASVSSATTSVVDRSDLLLRPGVPRWAIPLTAAVGDLIDYVVALPLLLGWAIIDIGVSPTMIALVPLVVAEFLLIVGVGYALAPIHVYARDVARVVEVALLLGFYLTPVFYDPAEMPERLSWVVEFNPVARVIAAQRTVLIDHTWPSAGTVVGLLLVGVVVLLAGNEVYRRTSPSLVDEL